MKKTINQCRVIQVFATFLVLVSLSCKTISPNHIDRTTTPEIDGTIPDGSSEIRELKYIATRQEKDHKVLHVQGQLFTKSALNGTSSIMPCNKCIVQLSTPGDTSLQMNLTTESDGYFSFEGKNAGYTIKLSNPGHKQVEIGPVFFQSGGVTSMKLINASGTGSEKFMVTQKGKAYSWQLVQ